MKVSYRKYVLDFKQPSGTSRGVLRQKETFFIEIRNVIPLYNTSLKLHLFLKTLQVLVLHDMLGLTTEFRRFYYNIVEFNFNDHIANHPTLKA